MSKNEFTIQIPDREMRKALKQINGYEDSALKAFSGLVRRTTMRVANEAIRLAPSSFGFLRQHITSTFKKFEGSIVAEVDYGEAVEKGTKPHVIRPRNKKALAFVRGSYKFWDEDKREVYREVKHPGTDPQPYLEPAVESEVKPFLKGLKKIFETGK